MMFKRKQLTGCIVLFWLYFTRNFLKFENFHDSEEAVSLLDCIFNCFLYFDMGFISKFLYGFLRNNTFVFT